MPPDGVQRFFKDVGVSLDGVDTFLVAWKLQLERMGYITKDEWTTNMGRLNVASPDRFMQYLNSWKAELASDERALPQLYQYTFGYAKTVGQKSMQVDVALVLWDLLLGQQYPHIPKFIEFINETHPVKVINKDQWSSLLDFIKSIPFNLEGYDSTSSCKKFLDDNGKLTCIESLTPFFYDMIPHRACTFRRLCAVAQAAAAAALDAFLVPSPSTH
ncbi:Cullin binding-domain-containing protein [Gongronella butleri]|nr:Cullin binding-domain-containing protein [Gongronella butleri]